MSLDISSPNIRNRAKRFCGGICNCNDGEYEDACDLIKAIASASDEKIRFVEKLLEHVVLPTRQNEFLKQFPKAEIAEGFLQICPMLIDSSFSCKGKGYHYDCFVCKKEYWLEEVEE